MLYIYYSYLPFTYIHQKFSFDNLRIVSSLRNYRVRAGTSVRSVGGFTTDIRHAIHHPSNNLLGDVGNIGLMRVRWELSFGPTIAMTHFMPEGFFLPQNVPLQIVGWGFTTVSFQNLWFREYRINGIYSRYNIILYVIVTTFLHYIRN